MVYRLIFCFKFRGGGVPMVWYCLTTERSIYIRDGEDLNWYVSLNPFWLKIAHRWPTGARSGTRWNILFLKCHKPDDVLCRERERERGSIITLYWTTDICLTIDTDFKIVSIVNCILLKQILTNYVTNTCPLHDDKFKILMNLLMLYIASKT